MVYTKVMSEKTVFERIIDRDIPADIVCEDDKSIVFMDIEPVNKGHVLVVPKECYQWFQEMPDDLLCHLTLVSKKIAGAIKLALSADYVQVAISGKDVPHVHIHLFPRYYDDKLKEFEKTVYTDGESKEYAQKIKNNL